MTNTFHLMLHEHMRWISAINSRHNSTQHENTTLNSTWFDLSARKLFPEPGRKFYKQKPSSFIRRAIFIAQTNQLGYTRHESFYISWCRKCFFLFSFRRRAGANEWARGGTFSGLSLEITLKNVSILLFSLLQLALFPIQLQGTTKKRVLEPLQ